MRRQLSSFDIFVIVHELQNIIGGYVDKIYQVSRDEVLIKFRNVNTKNKESLFIRNSEFICLTDKSIETPQKPSTFAMTLRKYLQNGRIKSIEQHEFDRIIKIKISKKQGDFTIFAEFLSEGNIILVDPEGKIILPFRRQSWAHRKVKGRQEYNPPPSQLNPFELDKKRFEEVLKDSKADLVRTLAVNFNLSGPIAEEICTRADVEKNTPINNIKNEDVTKTYDSLNNFLEIFENKKFNPVLVKKDGKNVDILPLEFVSYKDFDFEKINSFSRGLESFIELKPKKEEKAKIESKTDKIVGKLERMLKQQKRKINELKKEIEKKHLEGELIYLNYQKVEKVLDEIKKVLELKGKKEGIEKINELDSVEKFEPDENQLLVKLVDSSGNFFDVKLDFRKSVSENAEKAYDNSKKMKNKLQGAKKSIEKTLEKLKKAHETKKVEDELSKKEVSRFIEKKQKSFWFEKYRWFISNDGNIVVGGRDAGSNDRIVKKYLKSGDRYAHADISGAPSIVIKNRNVDGEKADISEDTLEEACIFAASYSKAWKQFAEAQAYWVLPEQVSKTAQSGEFVPRGAFIIRGKRNFCSCKLETAVGKINIDGVYKVMGGPVSAVEHHCDSLVVLEPSNTKKSDIAKKIATAFDVDVEEVSRVLPPGGAVIIRSKGVDL